MHSNRPSAAAPRLVLGLIVMLLGLMLTLDNFGVLDARRFWRLWPVLLIAMGVSRLVHRARTGGPPDGVGLTLLGLAFLLMNFHVLEGRQIFPLFLLGFGAILVLRATRGEGRREGQTEDSSARLDAFVIMGGVRKGSSAPDFQGGSASAVMGGCEIDLRNASIQTSPATIDTFAMWGGIEIRIPEDWSVEIRGTPFMGEFDDKTRRAPDERKKLIVTGLAIMGGVEVKN